MRYKLIGTWRSDCQNCVKEPTFLGLDLSFIQFIFTSLCVGKQFGDGGAADP